MATIDYESKVLRAFLVEPEVQLEIRSGTPAEFFLNARHRDVYEAATKYLETYHKVPSPEILKELLTALRPSEGEVYRSLVDRLTGPDETDDLQHLPYYLRMLDQEWRSAQAQTQMRLAIDKLKERDVTEALRILHKEVPLPYTEKIEGDISGDLYTAVEDAKARAKNPELYAGIPIGFLSVDVESHGHGRGELVVVVGGTGVGKSLVLGQVAINVAKRRKKVLLVTVENNKQSYMNRLYSNLSRIPYARFKSNQLDANDMDTWYQAMANLPDDFYLKIVEFPEGCSALDIWNYMRTLPDAVDYLVVDQITNMRPNGWSETGRNDLKLMSWQFYGQISLDLKRLAGYAYDNRGLPILSAAQAAGGVVGKRELSTDDIALGKIILHHAHGGLYVTRDEDEYTMGSSKYRDALIKPFPVFPEFKYWSLTENASQLGFSASQATVPYEPAKPAPSPASAAPSRPITDDTEVM